MKVIVFKSFVLILFFNCFSISKNFCHENGSNVNDSTLFVNIADQVGASVSSGLGYGGVAFADVNNDSLLDIFISVSDNSFTDSTEKNILLINTPEHIFLDKTDKYNLNNYNGKDQGGVLIQDFDNDGENEIFVVDFYKYNSYYNYSGNTYIDKASEAKLLGSSSLHPNSVCCTPGDFNNDGYLDLYVGNWNGNNYLYKNNGNDTYTELAGQALVQGNGGTSNAVFFDYDNDDNLDLLITNGYNSLILYSNNGNGTFSDNTEFSNLNNVEKVGYLAAGDYDNDGWIDIYCGKFQTQDPNILFHNDGNGFFSDVTSIAGVGDTSDCRSASFVDFDNDGYLDLFVSNSAGLPWCKNKLYKNNENGTFEDISQLTGFEEPLNGEGNCIWGDVDNDGDLDLFGTKSDACVLFQNQINQTNNWLTLKLIGTTSNYSAIGTKVYLYSQDKFIYRYVFGGFGKTQHTPYIHFGLNDASIVDSIRIVWPSNNSNVHKNINVNQFLVFKEGEVTDIENIANHLPMKIELYQNYPNPFNPNTNISYSIFKSGYVSVKVYNTQGQHVKTLTNNYENAGNHNISFSGHHLPSGIYFCELRFNNKLYKTRKMMLLK